MATTRSGARPAKRSSTASASGGARSRSSHDALPGARAEDRDPACLHCVNDEFYRWSISYEDGSAKSIWDWLDDLNASNFAGHSDWRIPNLRELLSIVHYGFVSPALDPVFGTSAVAYWSSTISARGNFNEAAQVYFNLGEVRFEFYLSGNAVRAVR